MTFFILDFNFFGGLNVFYKLDLSLKNKLRVFFPLFFVFLYEPAACSVFPGKNMAFLIFNLF